MKPKFKSIPSRSRPRLFQQIPLHLELGDLFAQSRYLRILGRHLVVAWECLLGCLRCSRSHLRRTFSCTSRSWAVWRSDTPRSSTNFTASSLNSRLNCLLAAIDSTLTWCPWNRQQATSFERNISGNRVFHALALINMLNW